MYLVMYDISDESRECWNPFYLPFEVFTSITDANARAAYIKANSDCEVNVQKIPLDIPAMSPIDR